LIATVVKSTLKGSIIVPGSKSHTIRGVLLSTMAKGTSIMHNPLASDDCLSSVEAARAFGAQVQMDTTKWIITGVDGNLSVPPNYIDTKNSGTTTSLIMGMASLIDGLTIITGDEQIRRRPLADLAEGLRQLGARIEFTQRGKTSPPVIVEGPVTGGLTRLSGFNSQFVSSILLSSPLAKEDTLILVDDPLEKPYLQMSLSWIKRYGGIVQHTPDLKRFEIKGNQHYTAVESTIPSDWSGVAFPLVAAVTTPSDVTITGLDFDDPQGDKVVLDLLIQMGASITVDKKRGSIHVIGGTKLKGGSLIDLQDIPDSFPSLAIAASYADGPTTFVGIGPVKVKETNRIAVMKTLLEKVGCSVDETEDSITIHGGAPLVGCSVDSYGDHRIAMAMTVCGLFCEGKMEIAHAECASVSFPGFYQLMEKLGAQCQIKEEV